MAGPRDGTSRRLGQPTARDTLNTTLTQKVPTRITPAGDAGDPRAVGELLNTWLSIQMDTVDSLVADAHAKVNAILDYHTLMLLIGELTVRAAWLETEVTRLRAERDQPHRGRRIA
jgi:uncharacterized small protein (DUF1192 family)